MNTKYDAQFQTNQFLNLRPEYLPYVGDAYDQYRILQVGESHYIEQTETGTEQYGINYFIQNWWTEKCDNLKKENPWEYVTRDVIYGFLNHTGGKVQSGQPGKFYSIFREFANAFCVGALNQPKTSIQDKKDMWKYFAFTDFFMMPSIYKGTNIEYSVLHSAKRNGYTKQQGLDILNDIEQRSVNVFDHIVDILRPNIIIFTSGRAGNAYKKNNGKYAKAPNVHYLYHPAAPGWNTSTEMGRAKAIELMK